MADICDHIKDEGICGVDSSAFYPGRHADTPGSELNAYNKLMNAVSMICNSLCI